MVRLDRFVVVIKALGVDSIDETMGDRLLSLADDSYITTKRSFKSLNEIILRSLIFAIEPSRR